MKQIKIKRMTIDNFKGCVHREIDFSDKTNISGQNASGKTTIFDSFTWLLFNKDSADNEKFAIRPLDADGKQIDNVDISVSAVIEIDGKEHELYKVQRQNWVKRRGSQEAKLQGNVNSFEIDGYPKKDAEYKAFIAEIINEDVFKMITSPDYFTGLPWKDQRATLMRFVSDMSDVELASGKDEFAILLPELEKAPSTDDIQKKYGAQKKSLTTTLKELPVRIDEIEKSKVVVDVAELELQKADLERKIADCDSRIKDANEDGKLTQLETERKAAKAELDAYVAEKSAENSKAVSEHDALMRKYDSEIDAINREIAKLEDEKTSKEKSISNLTEYKKAAADKWKEVKARKFNKIEFDENEEVCPVCNRRLPEDQIGQLHADFEKNEIARHEQFESEKQAEIDRITKDGKEAGAQIDDEKLKIIDIGKRIDHLKADLDGTIKTKSEHSEVVQEDYTVSAKYKELSARLADAEKQIEDAKNNKVDVTAIQAERAGYKAELDACMKQIALNARNVEIDERIAELQTEQRETAQKIADAEKMLFALEQFVKFKMDRVSNEINSHFNGIKFVLFETQINGGIKETCECTYNGVKYSDLNSGHRIVAGLEIIKAMQGLNDACAPVWIDNAESLNDFNMPEMDCQIVRLCVTDDKELVVE